PGLTVLATSREPLGIAGEAVWQVPPLSVPDVTELAMEPNVLMSYGAVRLFVERAARVQPHFVLSAYVAPSVAEICRRLDGIPLAIELAAARMEILTPAEILRRLDDRFGLLSKPSDVTLSHHQTLHGALDWSYELLSAAERALLRRVSVFVGGFELEAAETVCAGGEVEARDVRRLLTVLVAKSLVTTESADPSGRHGLLETIGAYASERLEEAGEPATFREAHARYQLLLAEAAEPELTGPDQARWLDRLETERDNLRRAVEWALGRGHGEWALRLTGALVLFWRVRCHFTDGRDLLEVALSASGGEPAALRAKVRWGVGFMTLMTGDAAGALDSLEHSLAVFREHGDLRACARALLVLGNCKQVGTDGSVLPLLRESAAMAREADDRWCLAHALAIAGFENEHLGEWSSARALFEESLVVAREAQDNQGLRIGLLGLGAMARHQGEYEWAARLFDEALAVARELGDEYCEAEALLGLGWVALDRGDLAQARERLERGHRLSAQIAPPGTVLMTLLLLGRVAHMAGDRPGARRRFKEALTLARDGIPLSTHALEWMADLAVEDGDRAGGRRLLEEALARAQGLGHKELTSLALHGLGRLARDNGDVRAATALHKQALEFQRQIGAAPSIVGSIEALGGLAATNGRHDHAAKLIGAAEALREENGYARFPWESAGHTADLVQLRCSLSREALDAAFAQGAALSIEQAATEAGNDCGRLAGPASGWPSLTEVQQQVAMLAAEGLTNAQIAARRSVTVGTVKKHLSQVFFKLGVQRRSEVAREVWRKEHQA
ncbi:MAG: tetratricopeptide repeat protein, partial [Actinomycetota bacterium]|nr:tetratricopeptide repeat protein [Actinomycetota bacterium]